MSLSRRAFAAGALAAPFVGISGAPGAADPMLEAAGRTQVPGTVPHVFTRGGMALGGWDPVAYFTEGQPRKGDPAYRLKFHGAVWQFATKENCIRFEMDPLAYKPRFGGHCAYTVAHGWPRKSEPDAWTIHDGRLYMNFNRTLRILWRRDIPRHIAMAEAVWLRIDHG